jgi:hypothetical protein
MPAHMAIIVISPIHSHPPAVMSNSANYKVDGRTFQTANGHG